KENRELWNGQRKILKKARPSSRKTSRLHRRGEGPLSSPHSLSRAQGLSRRLLRLAPAPAIAALAEGRAARGAAPDGPREEPQDVRKPAGPRGAAGAGALRPAASAWRG